MALTDLPVPPRPAYFGPDGAPPGVAVNFDAFGQWDDLRPIIKPSTMVVHTNGASVEASLQSQINWGNADKNNTKPHYCVNAPQPTKVVPSNRRAIANSSYESVEREAGVADVSYWTLAIETADTGYKDDPGISDFLEKSVHGKVVVPHAEIVARILAYESIVWDIPLVTPATWTEPGVVSHTDPFPFPYFTIRYGKSCPGDKKKARVRGDVLARANQIRAVWLGEEETVNPYYFTLEPAPAPLYVVEDGIDGHFAVYVTTEEWVRRGSPTNIPVISKAQARRRGYEFAYPVPVGVVA